MRAYKIVSFSAAILLIAVLFAGAVTVPAAAQYDTMQFHYNVQHTGDYSPVAGPVPSNGQLLWNYTTRGSVESPPAVANGVVYVGSTDNNTLRPQRHHGGEAVELHNRGLRGLIPRRRQGGGLRGER